MPEITAKDAKEASDMRRWCEELENSQAFQVIFQARLLEKRDEHLAAGTDVGRSIQERAEHHRAFHLANSLLTVVAEKKAAAEDVLERWREQEGRE